jgi:hypothetical protein
MQGKASDDNASRQTSIRKKLYHWINYSMEAHDDNIKNMEVNKKQVELRTLMIC